MDMTVHDFDVLDFSARWAAFKLLASSSLPGDGSYTHIHSPLLWLIVTFSLPGCSTICIPNTSFKVFCASRKTSLKCRDPPSPRTLADMSALRMGWREYSLAKASRTSFFTITFIDTEVCRWPPGWYSFSDSGVALRRRWVAP
ncbi:hypothetical protein H112_08283 [Trichophyton rubrum D6]|uniref:Uncharacterized protein n=3 Tax=Trichophyton TaxID=5550 RepID=A0A080WGS4_TRIRC|nr:uncharacterized protein TERG_11644 [Trichophyton rubrum CBS 118892]EZF10462.1 hypothetical protein H100_08306 [Trichophyton rubrum MR850]EZF37314.1 hypothetical protein H102_08265 [Trichophyton rubrum CBS 100081]EZF47938.1 hypothetical protein H103_08288 [Trichophyton rubrum CBS 288.86]EZF58561.1 hypothetical protein H104_08239 [Trichophyton rubrum CBS 289.86]EZF69139.1 hypothetical protein H105_08293 [Trichophyton soudanense CBS 452.61]EZF79941.1 hypothetical protein H110_08287 [Trichophy